ncbi:hypothetical protein EYF80_000612 [Liparis tanakae]|uniref:Uncharacterized protein n=1 Tax=Liparis tanakae TaxID=230148 RepID=A0A4Z2JHV5_9TELE|nr:hypothetical protein EYF80_000612 [Liparis tanakae]
MTDASLRNSILSRRLADSLTVFTATCVSGSPLMMSLAIPSYTMPKEPWPSSLSTVILSRGTSHSSGTYTTQNKGTRRRLRWGNHSQIIASCLQGQERSIGASGNAVLTVIGADVLRVRRGDERSGVAVVEPKARLGAAVRKKEGKVAWATPTERRRRDGLNRQNNR